MKPTTEGNQLPLSLKMCEVQEMSDTVDVRTRAGPSESAMKSEVITGPMKSDEV